MRVFLVVVFLSAWRAVPAAPPEASDPALPPGLSGTVVDAAGEPVAGAFVTVRDGTRQVSTRTDAEGEYHVPMGAAGPVSVRAHAIGLAEAAAVPVDALPARLGLRVERVDDVSAQLPSSAYLGALPDGGEKRRFVLVCGGCHLFNRVRAEAGPLAQPRSYRRDRTAQMVAFAGAASGFPIMAPGRDPDATADGLVQHLGAPGGPRRPDVGPDRRIWIPLFAAGALAVLDPATRVVWVATAAADAVLRFFPNHGRWSVHPLPTRGALVRHMELAADGSAWLAYGNSPALDPKVAHIRILD